MLICAARRAALGIIFDSTYARIDKERIKDLVQRVPPDKPTAAWVTTLLATVTYYFDFGEDARGDIGARYTRGATGPS